MLTTVILLALAPADVHPARDEWHDCLDRYAQVAMLSDASAWEIAKAALLTCSDERRAYQLELLRNAPRDNGPEDGPAFARRLADDDRAAAIRVFAFVNTNRRRR